MDIGDSAPRVRYPTWMKALGIMGLPVLAIVAGWMVSRPLWEEGLTSAQQIGFPLIGIAVLYQCYIGSRCLPHLNTVVALYDDGIEVQKGDSSKHYQWSELVVTEFPFATTTQILTRDGATVVCFSDGLANLDLMTHMIASDSV